MNFYTSAAQRGDVVYLRGYSNGKPFKEIVDIQPYLFFPDDTGDYKTLDGRPLKKRVFDSVKSARDFVKSQEELSNGTEFFGFTQYLHAYLNDEFPGQIEYDPELLARVSIDIEVMSNAGFPKAHEAAHEVTAITLSHRQNKRTKRIIFGCKPYKVKQDNVSYMMCKNERDLLQKFLEVWNDPEWTPDVVTGWNVEMFDIAYIVNRIKNILGAASVKLLSPWRIVQEREITRGKSSARAGKDIANRQEMVYEMLGITVLDYLELYKKFSFQNHESYKLDHIASVELGERKLDYSQWGSLHEFYEKDFDGYIDYNLDDTIKIDKLDDKLGLIDLVLAFAYDAKVTYQETMTTTRPWDVIIHNYLLDQKICVPQYHNKGIPFSLVGGWVKDVNPGMYLNDVSFDFDSLYPHLIMQFNISPETYLGRLEFSAPDSLNRGTFERDIEELRERLLKENIILAGNGCMFRKDKKGFLPELMEKMYADRVLYKKKMIEAEKMFEKTKDPMYNKIRARYYNLQMAKKLQLNSAYGALANEWFRWFDFDLAEAVTVSGQMATRYSAEKLNAYLNNLMKTEEDPHDFVIAADTDSIYVCFDRLVKYVGLDPNDMNAIIDFLDEACKKRIEPFIKKTCEHLAGMVNANENKLRMKRETIANKAIWKAKKMYILNVWDSEGVRYAEPKIKMKGIEAVRSSTPMVVRDHIKKALSIIMNKDENALLEFVETFRMKFHSLPPEDIAFPRGANNLAEYSDPRTIYIKGTPIQVKGALHYNKMVKDKGLENKYELIEEGTKVKFSYLKKPNVIRDTVIAWPDVLPPEFGLHDAIDRDMQFTKTFLDPIDSIIKTIGWRSERVASLADLL